MTLDPWTDPMSTTSPGPDYLPRTASVRTAMTTDLKPLQFTLALLQAEALLFQTYHWQAQGDSFFADHLLFERLYGDVEGSIDAVAEKVVGSLGNAAVNPTVLLQEQMKLVSALAAKSDAPDIVIAAASHAVTSVLTSIEVVLSALRASKELTSGVENLLQGVADTHESLSYLLQQRLKG